ncbi:MAG TPA: neocarzinostatin apoprotein domain-containing protein, partial [Acidimicrobiia bacterium]|nr:neocarzinostatin apoprotein domain-containing protein [Acidimicrobiia bacterium]
AATCAWSLSTPAPASADVALPSVPGDVAAPPLADPPLAAPPLADPPTADPSAPNLTTDPTDPVDAAPDTLPDTEHDAEPTLPPSLSGAPTARPEDPSPPDVVVAAPSITVTPDTDLVHGQVVTVAGIGFSPDTQVAIVTCTSATLVPDDCDLHLFGSATTDGAGAFSTPFTLRRIAHTANGVVDCGDAPGTCNIGVASYVDLSEQALAPLAFDPALPPPPPANAILLPSTGLLDGQQSLILGDQFPPNAIIDVYECLAGGGGCVELGAIGSDATGAVFGVSPPLLRTLFTPFGPSTDCASSFGTCEVVLESSADLDKRAVVPIGFDSSVPAVLPAIDVNPDTGLQFHHDVTVTGSGFPHGASPFPNGQVQVLQCVTGATSYLGCRVSSVTLATLDADGAFSVPFTARRMLRPADNSLVDCAAAPGTCEVVALAYGGASAHAALAFDPSAPVPPPPTVVVSPNTNLPYFATVHVTGTNYPPDTFLIVRQCLAADPAGQCRNFSDFAAVVTDASGSFAFDKPVIRFIRSYSTFPPSVTDCADAPGTCDVRAIADDDPDSSASAPIAFDPSAPQPTRSVTVAPTTGLHDWEIVSVHGEGFFPGDRVAAAQCKAGTTVLDGSCQPPQTGSGSVRGDGTFDLALRVRREIHVPFPAEDVSCGDAPGVCVVAVASAIDPNGVAEEPLSFSSDPSPAPRPTMTIDEPGPYDDGQVVTARGSGFIPGAQLAMVQCDSDNAPGAANCGAPGSNFVGVADANGNAVIHTPVRRVLRSLVGKGDLDCGHADPLCRLTIAEVQTRNAAGSASVPIAFRDVSAGDDPEELHVPARLAFTGVDSPRLALIGTVVLGLGLALVVLSRRRPRTG